MTLPPWVADPALAPVWSRVRSRLERNGLQPSGRVTVELTDRSQRHALGALLGRAMTRDRARIDLADLDQRLRQRSGTGGLIEVVETLTGGPMRDRAGERADRAAGREAPLALARELIAGQWAEPWAEEWVSGLRRTGLLTGRPDAERVVRDAVAVLRALTDPERPTGSSRVELAARLLGDAHALDEDRPTTQVVLRGLAAAAGGGVPATAAERRALWEAYGVLPDLVSRTCLTLGLFQTPGPVHITAWDLRRRPSFGHLAGVTALVCENPRVLEAVAERGGPGIVVCTSGEPNTVVTEVLALVSAAGAGLRYHGDFDWPGIAIANRVVARFGARPWRMTADDYLRGVRRDGPLLAGSPVGPSWDAELGAAMRATGRALHEETLLPDLLHGLDEPAGAGR